MSKGDGWRTDPKQLCSGRIIVALKALKLKLMIVIVGGIFTTSGGLQAQSSDAPNADRLKPLVEAMRKDLRTQKQSLIDEAMGLDAAEKAKFWTVYQG